MGKRQSDQLLWALFHAFSFSMEVNTRCITTVKQEQSTSQVEVLEK